MMPRQLGNIELCLKGAFCFNIQGKSTTRRDFFLKKLSLSETSVNIYQSRGPISQKVGIFIDTAVITTDVAMIEMALDGFMVGLYNCGDGLRVS
jgi:hypothetical protein